jgi:hypothetical protein
VSSSSLLLLWHQCSSSRVRSCWPEPIWSPGPSHDEFCHQVRRALAFPSATADLRDRCSGLVCTTQFRMRPRRNCFARAQRSNNTCPSTSALQRSSSQTTAKATSVRASFSPSRACSYRRSLGERPPPPAPPRTPPCRSRAHRRPHLLLPPRRLPLFRDLPVPRRTRVPTTWYPRCRSHRLPNCEPRPSL